MQVTNENLMTFNETIRKKKPTQTQCDLIKLLHKSMASTQPSEDLRC